MENTFTLEQLLSWTAEISGKNICQDRDALVDIIREVLDTLYLEESQDTLRRWCVNSCGCSIIMPDEMAQPLKFKLGDKVGQVRGEHYTFQGYERTDCKDYRTDLVYQGESPLYYDLPKEGARVAARALNYYKQGSQPTAIITGFDLYNDKVTRIDTTMVKNKQLDLGEEIRISQPDESPAFSKTIFSRIDLVKLINRTSDKLGRNIDTKLDVGVQFVWCQAADMDSHVTDWGLLAYYQPGDELPSFRKYHVPGISDCSCCYKIDILANLKMPNLVYDNEIIRGFSSSAIRNMLRAVYYKSKNDFQAAQYNAGLAMTDLKRRNEKNNSNSDQIPVFGPTSARRFPRSY